MIEPKKIEEGALAFHSGRWRIAARVTNAVIVSLLATIYILGKPLKGPLTRIGLDQPFRRVYVRITRGIRVYLLTKTMQDQIVADDRMVPEEEWSTRFREAISDLANKNSPEELGDYLEFGVYNGNSLSSAYKVVEELGYEHVRFFGFDSFEGLPEKAAIDDDEPWSPKMYECDIEITRKYLNARGVNWDRVFLLKGWFSDTLNQGTIEKFSIRKASVIMVDCDLYSSTVEALDFSEPLIQDEAIIFFDDWHSGGLAEKNKGEKLAFSEFLEKNPSFSVASLESYSENSEAFRITRSANFL